MASPPEPWKQSGLVRGLGIPAPTGQYRVGCVDLMHQLPGDEQGLLVRLYYPTEATQQEGYNYTPWMPNKKYVKAGLTADKAPAPALLSLVIGAVMNPKTPSLEKAPLLQANKTEGAQGATDDQPAAAQDGSAEAPPTFPVVVFSHGLKAMRAAYSAIVCDVASHGYIVACVEHRDRSACASFQRVPKPSPTPGTGGCQIFQDSWIEYQQFDTPDFKLEPLVNAEMEYPFRSKQIKTRVDDMKKSLDLLTLLNEGGEVHNMMEGTFDFSQFKGRMNLEQAAVMGHSYGGGTTVLTLAEDSRFKCGLALDAWLIPVGSEVYSDPTSISQPLYFINMYTFHWKENMKRMLPLTRPVQGNGMSSCRVLTIDGTHHLNQCDVPFAVPKMFQFGFKENRLDNETAHRVNMEICHAFLKRHLLKDPAYQQPVPVLDGTEGHSKHIIFGTNVDMTDKPAEPSSTDDATAASGPGGVQRGDGGEEEMEMGQRTKVVEPPEKGQEQGKAEEEGGVKEGGGAEEAKEGSADGSKGTKAEGDKGEAGVSTVNQVEGAKEEVAENKVEGSTEELEAAGEVKGEVEGTKEEEVKGTKNGQVEGAKDEAEVKGEDAVNEVTKEGGVSEEGGES